ncbi:MAG: ACP S-malonyltransferase [Desulfobacterota bacterium]|nr:ACP S-malonyltransferase [Thermodesulfobacteriota bacterium]
MEPKKTAFIFPGQGSQSVGMGKDLYDHFKVAREVFEEADEALKFHISKLCFEGPEEALKLTENTQPAILTVSIAALRVLQSEREVKPALMAGHSLGEYSALVASGAFSFADAVRVVRLRGRFMQEAVPVGEGAMAAVLGMEREDVERICQEASDGEVLTPANFNCPGQIVIAGHAKAVSRAIHLVKQKGKKAIPLQVSAPFHSPLMKSAGLRLKEVLQETPVFSLQVPVVTNVEAKTNSEPERVKPLLVEQVSSPVRWEESMRLMIEEGVERVIEIGPGKVLTGLMKRIDPKVETANVEDIPSLQQLS